MGVCLCVDNDKCVYLCVYFLTQTNYLYEFYCLRIRLKNRTKT